MGEAGERGRPAAEIPALPPEPPLDPHIQYAVAHLLAALSGQKRDLEYYGDMHETAPEQEENGQHSAPEKPPVSKPARRKTVLPKFFEPSEIEALTSAKALDTRRSPVRLRDRCMYELMYRAGLRVSELCNLTPRDVTYSGKTGRVRIVRGKTGDGTAYFDAKELRPLLEDWKRVRRELGLAKSPYLFCTIVTRTNANGEKSTPGGRINRNQVTVALKRTARRAGIENWDEPRRVSAHVLRHTYATELLNEGVNLRQVQGMMRHSNLRSTEVYLHVKDVDLERIAGNRERDPEKRKKR